MNTLHRPHCRTDQRGLKNSMLPGAKQVKTRRVVGCLRKKPSGVGGYSHPSQVGLHRARVQGGQMV